WRTALLKRRESNVGLRKDGSMRPMAGKSRGEIRQRSADGRSGLSSARQYNSICSINMRDEDRFRCVDCGECTLSSGEYYMVHDAIWATSGLAGDGGMLCLLGLERRIGRVLTEDDFAASMPKLDAWKRHVAARSLSP